MGRFYQHTTSPVVDYSYDVPFTELWKALEYKQGRQDAALNKLSIAKDKLTNLEYIPGSSDEEYLKQKQAEYDALSEQVSGMDLSGNQAALNTAISDFADDPRLANVQRNATFYKEQQDRMQTLADAGKLDYNNLPNWVGQTDFGNNILSERVMGIANPYPNAEAFFEGVDEESVARNPKMLDNILEQSVDLFANSGEIQNYINSIHGDPTDPVQRKAAARKWLEAAKAKYLANLGLSADGSGAGGGGGAALTEVGPSAAFNAVLDDAATTEEDGTATGGSLGGGTLDALFSGKIEEKDEKLTSLVGGTEVTLNTYVEDLAGVDVKLDTEASFGSNSLPFYEDMADAYDIRDEEGNALDFTDAPINSKLRAQEFEASQVFYDESVYREVEDEYEDLIEEKGWGAVFEITGDKDIDSLKDSREKTIRKTGFDPFDHAEGDYNKVTNPKFKALEVDSDGANRIKYLHQLQTLNLSGQRRLAIKPSNQLIMRDGKLYMKGFTTITEDEGDKIFTPKQLKESTFNDTSTWWKGGDWSDILSDETQILKKVEDSFGSDDDEYQVPIMFEVKGNPLIALNNYYHQHQMGMSAGDLTETQNARTADTAEFVKTLGRRATMDEMYGKPERALKELVRKQVKGSSMGIPENLKISTNVLDSYNIPDGTSKAITNKIETLKNQMDSDPRAEEKLVDIFTKMQLHKDLLEEKNEQMRNAGSEEEKNAIRERVGVYKNKFISDINSIAGLDLMSINKDEMINFGMESVGGGKYRINNLSAFNRGIESWADSKKLIKMDSKDYSNLEWESDITSVKDIYGSKVSSPYLSSRAKSALGVVNAAAKGKSLKIGVNSMARPKAIQQLLIDSPAHGATRGSSHSTGNGIDFDVTKNSYEHELIKHSLDEAGIRYSDIFHDNHLHIEILS